MDSIGVGWLVGQSVSRSVSCLTGRSVGQLVGYFSSVDVEGWLIGVDWLCWLVVLVGGVGCVGVGCAVLRLVVSAGYIDGHTCL